MLHLAAVLAVAIQVTPAERGRLAWVPDPRRTDGTWVSDEAHHLQPSTRDNVNAVIAALERETSAEIAVVIVDSTGGLEAQEFATQLHHVWGVGKTGKDNGVLLLWVPAQRKVFISVGYGLEGAIPDIRAARIRDEQILPNFRAGKFDDGVLAGVRVLAAAAREEASQQRQDLMSSLTTSKPRARGSGGIIALIGGIVAAIGASIGAIFGVRRWKRRRPRLCPEGHGKMRLLDERSEGAKLDAASQLEERLHSVDWDVWVCDVCGTVTRIPYRASFSQYHDCPQCKRRTVEESTRTLSAATAFREGLERATQICRYCGWKQSSDRVVPRVVVASSVGSSGGGSGGGGGGGGADFGGGSAGGGGAGGTY